MTAMKPNAINRLSGHLLAACAATLLAGCNLDEKQPRSAVPVNQVLTPAGLQAELPETRPQVLALSPDGKLLATSGKHELILIEPHSGQIHTDYNQTSLIRTIELMLGLPPMNQFDATATPMFDCFTEQPDFAPFTVAPNQVPLDQMNPELKTIKDPVRKRFAIASTKLPLDDADECPEDLFNRILWNAQKGSDAEYPAWAVTASENRTRGD
jgi:hypothetical protein